MKLDIYRNNAILVSVEIDSNTICSIVGMGENQMTTSFIVPECVDLMPGDYILHRKKKYKINEPPEGKKSNGVFYHDLVFEGREYDLYDKKVKHLRAVEFNYMGTPREHLQLIVNNQNEISAEHWSIGDVDDAEPKLLKYRDHSCRTGLTYVAQEFGMEYSFTGMGQTINLKKTVGRDTTLVFEIGRGKGLYEIARKKVSDKPVYTRVTGYGGDKNIPSDYRGGVKKLMFDDNGRDYVERNVSLYGIKEGSYENEEIYPRRTGVVSACSPDGGDNGIWWIEDKDIDFDINECLVEGVVAKLTFVSGDLAGNTMPFEITKYDAKAKRVYFNETDDDGYILPNTSRKPVIGYKYVITDIKMPQSYVDEAEAKLKKETIEFAEKNCMWQFAYPVKPNPRYIKKLNIELNVFDRVRVKDLDYGIDALIRIVSLSYPLVDPYNVSFTVAETIPYTSEERELIQQAEVTHKVNSIDKEWSEMARFITSQFNKLKNKIYDPDGKLTDVFQQLLMLQVGAESQNFSLNGVTVSANYNADMTKLHVTAGELIHNSFQIKELPKPNWIWKIENDSLFENLDINKTYYLYAKCSKAALTGEWGISDQKVMTDEISGYWCFLLGVLYDVSEGDPFRGFDLTKGMTTVVGDTITTGLIQSLAKNFMINLTDSWIDIVSGKSRLDIFRTNPDEIRLKGVKVISDSGVEDVIGVDRGVYNSQYVYYNGDTVTYNGSTYKYIYGSPTKGIAPGDETYWKIVASKGDEGNGIKSVTNYYLATASASGVTSSTGGWTTTVQSVTADKKYLWNYEVVTYTSGSSVPTTPCIIGTYGDKGTTGNGISSIKEHYAVSTSNTTAPTSWSDTVPDLTVTNKYLWNYETINYTDGSKVDTTKRVIGVYGDTGKQGSEGNFTEFRYAKNGSMITPPSLVKTDANPTGWSVMQPSVSVAEYLWMISTKKTGAGVLIYNWSDPVRVTPADGTAGKPGPGIVFAGDYSATETYYGTDIAVVAVRYNGQYYLSRIDAGTFTNKLPTDIKYWNYFTNQFESIATKLLLAENANLANFIFRNQCLTSQAKTNNIYNILLNGVDGNGHFAAGNLKWDAVGNILMKGRIGTPYEVIKAPSGTYIYRDISNADVVVEYTNSNVQAKKLVITGDVYNNMVLTIVVRSLESPEYNPSTGFPIGFNFTIRTGQNGNEWATLLCFKGSSNWGRYSWNEYLNTWIELSKAN